MTSGVVALPRLRARRRRRTPPEFVRYVREMCVVSAMFFLLSTAELVAHGPSFWRVLGVVFWGGLLRFWVRAYKRLLRRWEAGDALGPVSRGDWLLVRGMQVWAAFEVASLMLAV